MTFLCNQGHSLNFLFSDSSSFRTLFDVSLVSKTSVSIFDRSYSKADQDDTSADLKVFTGFDALGFIHQYK